ncbi:SusC/RagA family TonB-linked outer membrane protein [Chitinophaga lutea]
MSAIGLAMVLLMGGLLSVHAADKSQNISFSGNQVSLSAVFSAVEKQSPYVFIYDNAVLELAKPVSISMKNTPVEKFLAELFKTQPLLKYAIDDKNIFVSRRTAAAQPVHQDTTRTVRGRVIGEAGEPLPGVSVVIKGTRAGTSTNVSGEFLLAAVEENAVLEISSVGFEKREVSTSGKSVLPGIVLKASVSALDEAVVIAYGSTTKRFSTSNIGTVKAEDIARQPVTNPLLAMQGRVPGIVITPGSALNNGGVKVTIQGNTNLTPLTKNDPLYVIDGVPYTAQLAGASLGSVLGSSGTVGTIGNPGSPMNFINPSDIERIDVLKDADATAIYGSRAANGAILITTKRGKTGKMSVDLNANTGFSKALKFADVMNTEEYLTIRREAHSNFGLTPSADRNSPLFAPDLTIWDQHRYTDWQQELLGKHIPFSTLEATISGGSNGVSYRISGTYRYRGTMYESEFGYDNNRKASVNASVSTKNANNRFRSDLSVMYMYDVNKMNSTDLTGTAYATPPNAPALYNSDGSLNWDPDANGNSNWSNPLRSKYQGYSNNTTNLVSSLQLSYILLKGLQLKTLFGYNNLHADEYAFTTKLYYPPETRATGVTSGRKGTYSISNWSIEPQILYSSKLGPGILDALVGTSFQQADNSEFYVDGSEFTSDQAVFDIKQAGKIAIRSNSVSQYKYNAVFSRINYNLMNRYIVNFSVRRDGSSRFGRANRFHNFTSVGSAWLISEEHWFKRFNSILNFLKLRTSYGATGNDQIGDYGYYNLYSKGGDIPYQGVNTIASTGLSNPYLQWEETRKLDVGVDFHLWKSRLMITADYVRNRSGNQLVNYFLPATTGSTSITRNFPGLIENSAIEATLSSVNVRKKDFSWSTNVNISLPRNRLVRFENLESSTYANTFKIGEPTTVVRLYRYAGVNPETGVYEFYAADGSKTSTPKPNIDNTIYQNRAATLTGGLQNTLTYKGIQLDLFFQYARQVSSDQAVIGGGAIPGTGNNMLTMIMSRWQKKGDVTNVQKVTNGAQLITQIFTVQASDLVYRDASFVRLKNVNISYSLPAHWLSKVKFRRASIYAQGQNIWTWTGYKGMDPDLASSTVVALPSLFTFVAGINISL